MTDWSWVSFYAGSASGLFLAGVIWLFCEFRNAPMVNDDPRPIPDEELGR